MITQSLLSEYKSILIENLQNAAIGKPSCFSYIANEIRIYKCLGENDIIQVFVIGGTVSTISVLEIHKDRFYIQQTKTLKLDQFSNKEDFFNFISLHINEDIKHLVINFAYPLRPVIRDDKMDGILLSASKNHQFAGLYQLPVGEAVEHFLYATLHKRISVYVINDVIASLVSGISLYDHINLAAGIIGTGLNFSFFKDSKTAINLEASNFTNCLVNVSEEIFDINLVGKKISGAYLYKYFNEYVENKKIYRKKLNSTKELDTLAMQKNEPFSGVATKLLEQSAQLAGILISAITEFRETDITFVMQGSLYTKGVIYKQILQSTVLNLTEKYKSTLIIIPSSDIFGAASLLR